MSRHSLRRPWIVWLAACAATITAGSARAGVDPALMAHFRLTLDEYLAETHWSLASMTIIARDEDGREGYFDVWFKFADVSLPTPLAAETKPAGTEQPPEPARKE